MTRFVIHNYLPVKPTCDSKSPQDMTVQELKAELVFMSREGLMQKSAYKPRADALLRELKSRSASDADDLQRYAGDVIWTDVSEAEYSKLNAGSTLSVEGIPATVIEKDIVKTHSGVKYRVKVRFKATGKDVNSRDFRGVVSRDVEERNRDRMYRDAGITRI